MISGSPPRRARLAASILVAVLLLPVAIVAAPAPAGAACSPPSTKKLSGTLLGEDGRYVSAMIGVELFDSAGRSIGADGCVKSSGGYSHLERLNEYGPNGCCFELDHNGSTDPKWESTWDASAYQGPLPANAAYAWIEVYPKSKTEGPSGHLTSYRRYGGVMRRMVPIQTGLHLRLPLGCGLGAGGDNGSIEGRVTRFGSPIAVNDVMAWSRAPDGPNPIMGFVALPGRSDGTFTAPQLPPGQRYALRLITPAGGFWVENDYGPGLAVNACRATRVSIDVGYHPPRVQVMAGADSVGVRRGTELLLTNQNAGGAAGIQYSAGEPGDLVVAGDWDGDGVDTIGLRRGAQFLLTNRTDGQGPYHTFSYGWAGDTVVVGDWDGNGTDTIGVRRNNVYHLRNHNSSGPGQISLGYGLATDTPVVGDWDGNGTDTIGIRRNNAYYLRNANTTGPGQINFGYGVATDTPIVGDWDGNGTDTVGLRRGTMFHLRYSNTTGVADNSFSFGLASDVPLAGDWDGG